MLFSAVAALDYHTAGEPFRIIEAPPIDLAGDSVADRRIQAIADPAAQELREFLCFEPRGHADMYGGFIVPPDDAGAHFGVLFWHKDGFSTACGHGTIAPGVWAVETGRVAAPRDGSVDVIIDVPSGRVTARVHRSAGRVASVDFVNVASYVLARAVTVPTARGEVQATLSFAGAIYAKVSAVDLGELIALGREIKWALNDSAAAAHPTDPRLSGVYGTILYEHLGTDAAGRVHQRNVTVFADGEVDRSPCGSGTCARLATLHEEGTMTSSTELTHESIVGTTFTGRILELTRVGERPALIPQVTGMAYRTGEHTFTLDPADPIKQGFVLR